MIKIEFPADRADIAREIGAALVAIGGGTPVSVRRGVEAEEVPYPGGVTIHADGAVPPVATVVQTAAGHVNVQTGEVVELELPATPGDAARLDLKGVPFDARYCANAQDPFYASGKEAGQWKAKRGLAAGVYENWYATQLATTTQAPADEDTDPTPTVATGAAFGAAPQQPAGPILRTAGEFMAWVSEKQTAGKLTQEAINAAYAQLGIRVQDLFPPTPDNVIANNIAALYGHLSPFAGA